MKIMLAVAVVTASASARTVSGTVVHYGDQFNASTGPVTFKAGSIHMAADLTRVKLLIDHDPRQPVGYLTSVQDSAERMDCTFHVPEGEAGDRALTEAANGLRDGFSVGVWADEGGYEFDDDYNLTVTSGTLREVSLCAIPADDDARAADVAASRHPKGTTMPCSTCGKVHAPGVACSAPQPQAAAPQAPTPTQASAEQPPATPPTQAPAPQASAPQPAAPVVQQAAPINPPSGGQGMHLPEAMRVAAGLIAGHEEHRVAAALGDIVPANDVAPGYLRPAWVGELWRASVVQRPLIDAIGPTRPLTAMKVQGFHKVYTDLVDEYDGNKTDIPSGTFTTQPAEASAQRWAGGNDIDRIFFDLGDPGFLESWFTAATDDYKGKSEAYVALRLLAAATAVTPAPATVTSALGALGLRAAALGANISFVAFAADVWAEFIELPDAEVPWWLRSQGSINLRTVDGEAGGIRFSVNQALPAGTVLGGDSRAATFYEVDPPIRVQAVNIPQGGIDVGVFGYGALLVNDARALFKATVTPA